MDRHERLQQARRAAGFERQRDVLERYTSWNRNTYKSNENGSVPFSFDRARIYAKAFKVRAEWLYAGAGQMRADDAALVPILGYVGANPDGSVLFASGQAAGDMVPPPPNGSMTAKALEVRGHSMPFLAEDGALIYFDNQRTSVPAEMLGQVVVCELDSGEVLVKRLLRGSRAGVFDLESINGPTRHDTILLWIAEVVAIIPPRAARELIVRSTQVA